MKFTIQRGDVKVEVEAAGSEASLLLQGFLAPTGLTPVVPQSVITEKNGDSLLPPTEQSEVERFNRFYKYLGASPRYVLDALLLHPRGLADVDLKSLLAPKGVTTLAGSMTAIVKGCKRLKIPLQHVLVKDNIRDRERNSYFFYKLGSGAREMLLDAQKHIKEEAADHQ